MMLLPVEMPDETDVCISGMELQSDGCHFLRTCQQYITSIQMEEIRALPHFSVLVMTGSEHTDILPMQGVSTFKEKDCSAVVFTTVTDYCVIMPVLFPDFRISEIMGASAFRKHGCINNRV